MHAGMGAIPACPPARHASTHAKKASFVWSGATTCMHTSSRWSDVRVRTLCGGPWMARMPGSWEEPVTESVPMDPAKAAPQGLFLPALQSWRSAVRMVVVPVHLTCRPSAAAAHTACHAIQWLPAAMAPILIDYEACPTLACKNQPRWLRAALCCLCMQVNHPGSVRGDATRLLASEPAQLQMQTTHLNTRPACPGMTAWTWQQHHGQQSSSLFAFLTRGLQPTCVNCN